MLNHHRRPDADGLVKLARLPIRHPNAAMRGGFTREIAGVQSVGRKELDKERHLRSEKAGTSRARMFAHIDVCFHHFAGIRNVIPVKARPMIFIFSLHAEMASRRAISFPSARNPGLSHYLLAAIQESTLLPQIYGHGGRARMSGWDMRTDEIAHRPAGGEKAKQTREGCDPKK
jgi:hypothetical protein